MSIFSKLFKPKKAKKKVRPILAAKQPRIKQAAKSVPDKKLPSKKFPPIDSSRYAKLTFSIDKFKDIEKLKKLTYGYVDSQIGKTSSFYWINRTLVGEYSSSIEETEQILDMKEVRDLLSQARRELKAEGKLGYDGKTKNWHVQASSQTNLTPKEKSYLKHKGLGDGWKRIPDKLKAIEWLHKNFSDDEFEQFCCALLSHSQVDNVQVTPKRVSGADGGLDGTGVFMLDGEHVQVAFEAKRHALKSQVGSHFCQKLYGAMAQKNIKYGFIITTAIFSKRAEQSIEDIKSNTGGFIELIDQNRMADIMLEKKDAPHGLGLHQTDIGLVYMNEDILRKSVH